MNLGAISLGALALAVLVSCTTRLNVGLLAIVLASAVGVFLGGMTVRQVAAGFPVDLFLTLAGVTLLFSQAQVNGTLERVTRHAVTLCRGRVGMVPVMFFFLGAVIASLGPGNIATAGLLAPIAMATAMQMRISPFLMAIMVGNGANSGSLSPLAPTGIIVTGLMAKIQLAGHEAATWLYNLGAHAVVAFAGYFLFGGVRLLARRETFAGAHDAEPLEKRHWTTIGVIGLALVAVIAFKANLSVTAFAAALLLNVLNAAEDEQVLKKMPWGTILMVCGMTVLISLVEKTQGLDLFTGWVANVSTEATIIPLLAVAIGIISAYSSTSGVVLPAFLPMVPGLVEKLGGGEALAIASTMNVAGHLVDVSPLSTIGALCVASIPGGEESRRLFHQLLAWGLSMAAAGAAICWVFFG